MRRAALAIAAAGIAIAAMPATAHSSDPARQPPFGGDPVPPLERPERARDVPPGFELSAREAIAAANATEAVREERRESPAMRPTGFIRGDRWEVKYFIEQGGGEDGERVEVAQVVVDGDTGRVLEAWRDHQVETKLARGYDGAVGRAVNSPWIWIGLCVAFVLPFIDPRRPLRLLHLDLLVIAGLSVSLFFFNQGEITTSVPLVYPALLYLFVRLLVAGLRPRRQAGALVPLAPVELLAAAALALAAGRIALNVVDSSVIDIGLASVVGADRIADGESLYEGVFAPGIDLRGDVYGPLAYLAYVPFEQLFPWSGVWDEVPAAHAAAITFDLLTALGLLALGARLRPGREGRGLGVALAFAWLACPWTAYALNANTNDALVSATIVAAMLALSSPALRGTMLALGAAAKFGPAALAPLFATGDGRRRWRSAALFAIAFAVVALALFVPFLPDGGPRELYDRTIGYQAGRGSPFSVWGLAPSLDALQAVARVAAVGLAVLVAFVPRHRSPAQIAALGAAVLIAVQAAATHWFYFYVVWFLPLALIAVFWEPRRTLGRAAGEAVGTEESGAREPGAREPGAVPAAERSESPALRAST